MKNTEKLKKGQRIAGIATIATFFLALFKAVVGFLSGSVALIADSMHSIADIVAIFASWSGLKISQRKPDEEFNYGYYKAENIATLVVSVFVFYAAYRVFMESISKFSNYALDFAFLAMAVSIFSSFVSYFIAYYESKVGKEINSQSLIANAQESRLDVLSSFIVFVGILMTYLKIPYVESIIGILISMLIFKVAFQNTKLSLYALMDAAPDKKLLSEIRKTILSHKVIALKNLKLRQSGPFVFGEATIIINKDMDINKAHDLCIKIESSLSDKFPQLESFILHTEPAKPTDSLVVAVPLADNKGLSSKTTDHLGRANYFLFARTKGKKINGFYIKENTAKKKKLRAGLSAAKQIVSEKADVVLTKRIGEISFHTLKDSFIDIYLLNGNTAGQAIENFFKGRSANLKGPTHESDK